MLTPTQRARLAAAVKSDTTMAIVTADGAGLRRRAPDAATARSPGASGPSSVRDVAWAASPEYLWDASGWDGILAQAYYRPSAARPGRTPPR